MLLLCNSHCPGELCNYSPWGPSPPPVGQVFIFQARCPSCHATNTVKALKVYKALTLTSISDIVTFLICS